MIIGLPIPPGSPHRLLLKKRPAQRHIIYSTLYICTDCSQCLALAEKLFKSSTAPHNIQAKSSTARPTTQSYTERACTVQCVWRNSMKAATLCAPYDGAEKNAYEPEGAQNMRVQRFFVHDSVVGRCLSPQACLPAEAAGHSWLSLSPKVRPQHSTSSPPAGSRRRLQSLGLRDQQGRSCRQAMQLCS